MRWSWDVRRYESGVPRETEWDRLMQIAQPVLVVVFACCAILGIDPMGWSGGGGIRLLCVLAASVLLLTVPVPDRLLSLRARFWIALVAAVPAGVLMGLAGQGWGGTFSYMLGMHATIRFPVRVALRIILLDVCLAIVVALALGEDGLTPWWTNLMVLIVVIPGMARRSRQLSFEAADAVVVQTRRAAESESARAALAERAAIARDIHDVLAHSLSGINMQLSLADALFDADQPERAREAVRTAQHLAVDGLDEARSAVQTLRGDTIDPVEAVGRILTGDHETLALEGAPCPLPGRVTHALIRVAQEAVTNARRHAPGAPLDVVLDYRPERVTLSVANAHSASPASHDGSGLGLLGMRERAAGVGATLEAGPLPPDDPCHPAGWLVRLELPREES